MGATKKALAAEKAARAEPPKYTGTWHLVATRESHTVESEGIRSFELVDGVWFTSNDSGVSAIAIANWDAVSIFKDDPDE